jgi:hypothetical protein
MFTNVTFYKDNIAIIINNNVTRHVVNNKMTNLIWQNNIDNTKNLNIEKNLYLNPMGTYKGAMLHLNKKKPKSLKKKRCSTLKPTIMQTICKRV